MKTCTKCGIEKELGEYCKDKRNKDGRNTNCRACEKERLRKYYQDNLEKRRECNRKHYRENAKKVRENVRKYYQENAEKVRKRICKWGQENSEKKKEADYKWRQNNVERKRENDRKWRQENPEKRQVSQQRRRARKLEVDDGTVTNESLEFLLEEQEHKCYYCSTELHGSKHIEHLTPLSRGGLHTAANVRWSCSRCNLSKGTKTAEEFMS